MKFILSSKIVDAIRNSGAIRRATVNEAQDAERRRVLLDLLAEIAARYERGASELQAELELPEITDLLLMEICLAAPAVDDLVLGFIREDLHVVSRSEQTSRLVERDLGMLAAERSGWSAGPRGPGQALNVRQRAEAEARLAQGLSSELESFILQNADVYARVCSLPPQLLARWIMLQLFREMQGRSRSGAVLADWRKRLDPRARQRLDTLRQRYLSAPQPLTRKTAATPPARLRQGPSP